MLKKKKRVRMYLIKSCRILLLLLLFSLLSSNLYAQEEDKSDCVLKLEQAQTMFDQGRIQDVEPLIGKCIAINEFDKVEKAQALKLLTLAYLFLEEPELAEANMLQLLNTNHEFAVNPSIDPSEFINLYEKFRHEPLLSVGVSVGALFTAPIITELNSTQDLNNDSRQSYSPKLGFRFGLNVEYKFATKLYANVGVSYQIANFQKTDESLKIITSTLNGGFEAEETQNIVELPLLVQYHLIEKSNITLYASAGISPQFLLSSTFPSDAIKYELVGSAPVTSGTITLTSDRTRFNLSVVAIGGLKYKFGEGYFKAQVRYSHQILNASKSESSLTPSDPNLLWDFTESYDGFRLHDLGFSFGYTFHYYKPKKLR